MDYLGTIKAKKIHKKYNLQQAMMCFQPHRSEISTEIILSLESWRHFKIINGRNTVSNQNQK